MSNPCVTVQNNSSRDVFVSGDPNWDDQELFINGKLLEGTWLVSKGESVEASVDWGGTSGDENMMGIIFSEEENYDFGKLGFFQMTIGRDQETGNLGVTDCYTKEPLTIKYNSTSQKLWTFTLGFEDIKA